MKDISSKAGKTIVREPVEILKTAAEQTGARPPQEEAQRQGPEEAEPSAEERRKGQRLQALEAEIRDIKEIKEKKRRLQEEQEEEMEKKKKAALKEQKKENVFQKLVKRLQRRVEGPKLPQAT